MPVISLSPHAPAFRPQPHLEPRLLDLSELDAGDQIDAALDASRRLAPATYGLTASRELSVYDVAGEIMRALDRDRTFDSMRETSLEPKHGDPARARRFNRKADTTIGRRGFSLESVEGMHSSKLPPQGVRERLRADASAQVNRVYTLRVTSMPDVEVRRLVHALATRFGTVALYGRRPHDTARIVDLEHAGWTAVARPPSPAVDDFVELDSPPRPASDAGSEGVFVGE